MLTYHIIKVNILFPTYNIDLTHDSLECLDTVKLIGYIDGKALFHCSQQGPDTNKLFAPFEQVKRIFHAMSDFISLGRFLNCK